MKCTFNIISKNICQRYVELGREITRRLRRFFIKFTSLSWDFPPKKES